MSLGPAELQPPPFQTGERLSRDEFERRYRAAGQGVWAELIDGVVYVLADVPDQFRAEPCFDLIGWLGTYRWCTHSVRGVARISWRLDADNEPQPDACLLLLPGHGGRARTDADGFLVGAPELVAEVAANRA